MSFDSFFSELFTAIFQLLNTPITLPEPIGRTTPFIIMLFFAILYLVVSLISGMAFGREEKKDD